MRNFWTLLKMQLDVNFGFSALKYRFTKEKDKIGQTIAMTVAVIFGVGSLLALYSLLMAGIYSGGVMVQNPELVLALAFLGLQVFLLLTGIFYVLGVFFYSRDMSALIPLPLRPWQVLGAKFAVVLAYEYLMALPVLLPPLLIYGIGQSAGLFYWIKALLLMLVSPALPLLVASLLAIVLMRFLNVGRRKDLLAIIGGTLAMVLVLGVNVLTQRAAGAASDTASLMRLLANQTQFVQALSRAFPPSAWATLALSETGLASVGYLLLYLGLSGALLALMLWLSNLIYYKTAVRSEEISRRKPSKNAPLAAGNASGPVKAIFLRDLKLLLRTPAFAMNCLVGTFIVPIILPLSLLQNDKSSEGIAALLTKPTNSLYVTLGAAGFMLFSAFINVTASTAFSREGRGFWLSRAVPVPPGRQVYAKFLLSMSVAGTAMLLSAILLLLVLKFSAAQTLLALVLGLLGAAPITAVNMLPDLFHPKLLWTNPYEAVKQNMNVLLAMLLAVVLIGVDVAFTLILLAFRLNEWGVYLALAALQIALAVAGLRVLEAASSRYYKIEA